MTCTRKDQREFLIQLLSPQITHLYLRPILIYFSFSWKLTCSVKIYFWARCFLTFGEVYMYKHQFLKWKSLWKYWHLFYITHVKTAFQMDFQARSGLLLVCFSYVSRSSCAPTCFQMAPFLVHSSSGNFSGVINLRRLNPRSENEWITNLVCYRFKHLNIFKQILRKYIQNNYFRFVWTFLIKKCYIY